MLLIYSVHQKFNKAYQFEPTSYEEGIRKTALWTLDQS